MEQAAWVLESLFTIGRFWKACVEATQAKHVLKQSKHVLKHLHVLKHFLLRCYRTRWPSCLVSH